MHCKMTMGVPTRHFPPSEMYKTALLGILMWLCLPSLSWAKANKKNASCSNAYCSSFYQKKDFQGSADCFLRCGLASSVINIKGLYLRNAIIALEAAIKNTKNQEEADRLRQRILVIMDRHQKENLPFVDTQQKTDFAKKRKKVKT